MEHVGFVPPGEVEHQIRLAGGIHSDRRRTEERVSQDGGKVFIGSDFSFAILSTPSVRTTLETAKETARWWISQTWKGFRRPVRLLEIWSHPDIPWAL